MEQSEVAAHWEANATVWTDHARRGLDIYRDRLNTPSFLAFLPPVAGLDGLDIGCGEGANTRALARLGARMTALDIAPTFIRHACGEEARAPLGIAYHQGDGAALSFADGVFDFATAFMALMDMPRMDLVLKEAGRVLKPGGFLQFSILHPCFVPPHRKVCRDDHGAVTHVELARYFDHIDGEVEEWWFSTLPKDERSGVPPFRVPRFHRTLSEWVAMVTAAGLHIEAMNEPMATTEEALRAPLIADTRVVPLFLHMRCRKAG